MALDPEGQRLESLQEEERVERRQRRPQVAQQLHSQLEDERQRTERLGVDQPVIGRVRRREFREPFARDRTGPVEAAGVHHRAADRRAVSADPLGRRVDDDVGAVLDGPAQCRGAEGVVHHERDARRVGDVGQSGEVGHVEPGIADRLDEEEPGAVIDGLPYRIQVVNVHELRGDSPLRQRVGEEVVGPPVKRLGGDQVVSRPGEVEDGEGLRGLPAREAECRHTSFQLRQPLLEHIGRRVHDAGVDVPEFLQTEERRRVRRYC